MLSFLWFEKLKVEAILAIGLIVRINVSCERHVTYVEINK